MSTATSPGSVSRTSDRPLSAPSPSARRSFESSALSAASAAAGGDSGQSTSISSPRGHGAIAVDREVREQQAALTPREPRAELAIARAHLHRPA